jgi:hypothetical protein
MVRLVEYPGRRNKDRRGEMEALTRAVWEFMEGAYRKGLLDELLGLLGELSDPQADLGELLGDFEDRLAEADFAHFEGMSREVLTPVLQALGREEVLESLHVLLISMRPMVDGVMERVGGDPKVLNEVLGLVKQNLASLMTVAVALMPVLAKVYGPAVEKFIEEGGGVMVANATNTACARINRNPEIATRIISDVFSVVDGRAFGAAADTVVGAVLDHKPRVIEWTASTLVKRARKRLRG